MGARCPGYLPAAPGADRTTAVNRNRDSNSAAAADRPAAGPAMRARCQGIHILPGAAAGGPAAGIESPLQVAGAAAAAGEALSDVV